MVSYELKWANSPVPDQDNSYTLKKTSLLNALKPKPKPIAQPLAVSAAVQAAGPGAGGVVADKTGPVIDLPAALNTASTMVEIFGTERDELSQVIELTIGKRRVPIAGDGTFRICRAVRIGTSILVIAALDEWGNRTEKRIALKREVAAATAGPAGELAPNSALDRFSEIQFGDYYALVIGNNDYVNFPDLKMALADADAISTMLREDYGFKVEILTNATRGGIIGALARMRAKLKTNDNLLIYYAGHGILDPVTETGYCLPVDAEQGYPSNWISTSDITTMMRAIRARHVMVVADSYYSGTPTRAVDANIKTNQERVGWITRMVKKRSRTALVSGGLEPVLDSGGSGHSVFARAFVDALAENKDVMEGGRMFDRIKRPVALNSKQTLRYSDIRFNGHDGGDFVFVRRKRN